MYKEALRKANGSIRLNCYYQKKQPNFSRSGCFFDV